MSDIGTWKTFFNGKHFESGDIPDGGKPLIKITAISACDPDDTGGEAKMQIAFEPGQELKSYWSTDAQKVKGKAKNKTTWICAKTIGYQLEAMFGKDPAAWVGKLIGVYVAEVKREPAVRVYGSPAIDRDVTIEVRDFGGKRRWTMKPMKAGTPAQ